MSTNMSNKAGGCGCGGGMGGWTAVPATTRCGCGGAAGTSSGGCGCGSGGSCGCGGAGCATCRPDGFVYPRFFGGELLTEDDLSLLIDYVVAKNRLHNRALWGDGVVCGLEVTCHPCDPGKVIVQPGYALDCCGNDIVVPCPQELDINAMVRDLRRQLKGDYDCTDPCMERTVSRPNAPNQPPPSIMVTHTEAAIYIPPARKYCLYVRFCEQLTDPVAPYATDGSCPPQPCEPTRVREGFRFELRCPAPGREDDTVAKHFLQCVEDMAAAEQSLAEGVILSKHLARLDAATRAALTETAAPFDETHVIALGKATTRLATALDATTGRAQPPDRNTALLEAVDAAREVGSLLTRLALLDRHAMTALSRAHEGLAKEREAALEQLHRATEALTPETLADITAPLDRDLALATMTAVLTWPRADAEALKATEPRLFVEGAVWNASYETAYAGALTRLQSTLLAQMEKAAHPTLCALNLIVKNTPVPSAPTGVITKPGLYVNASSQILAAASRWYIECLCLALNPPCPPCEDPAVLLACIDVKNCIVIDICNMVRRFVLTWLDMRYWLGLGAIGKRIEALCCPPLFGRAAETHPMMVSMALPGMANLPQMLSLAAPELAAPDVARFRRVAALAGELAADRLGVPDPLSALTAPAAAPDVTARLTQLEQENHALAERIAKLERRR